MSEEKKISIDDLENLLEEQETDSSTLNFQTIFAMLVLNWQWFLLSVIICVSAAMIYLRYVETTYSVSARMLIKDETRRSKSNQMLSNMEDLGFMTNSTGIENEVEIIQSRILMRDVVKDLKLYTEYRSIGRVLTPIIYGNQPINVDMDPTHLDSLDIKLLNMESADFLTMEITMENGKYHVQGKYNNVKDDTFSYSFTTMPASYATRIGTLTFTANAHYSLSEGAKMLVSLRPPMQVATQYLGKLSVQPTSKMTSIAELTLKDQHPKRGMDFLRQLAVCYNRQANADKNEIALKTEEFINDRISRINAELGTTESELEAYKRQNAMTDLRLDATQSVQMSGQFSNQLSEASAQIMILDNLREYVNNPDNKYQLIPSNVGMTDAAANGLIASYNQAVQDRNRLLKAASEQAPQVLTLTATIDELRSSIQTALLQARRSADINRQSLQAQYAKYQGRVTSSPVAERILNQIGRQQDVKSGLYLMLLQKREENSISLAATADKGKLIDEPLFQGPVSPKRNIILLVALLIGLLVPGVIIWLLEFFRYKIEGHEDLARLTNLPIIADVAIASENVKGKAGIVVQANKNNQIDEIFRSMRTNIQFMLKGDEKVILFTSSTSGEGKTFNAANLAVSFALLGKKVVLCGLDIRKPALGRLFDVSDRSDGITTLLATGDVTRKSVHDRICPSGVNDNLELLLAGPVPPNPTELLAREAFGQIMQILREDYDYVILDTAPVGLVTDTIQIAQHSDINVYVCRADYTPKSAFGLINQLATEEKTPNACIVLNGIDMSKKKYGYYYGYGRYGRYGRYGYGRYGYGKYGYGRYGYGNYGNYGSYGQYANSHYGNKADDSIKK